MFKPKQDFYQGQDLSDLVPRKEKNTPPYLIAMADDLISRLVTGRPELRKLRDFYEGRRSPQAFAHLTDNYGIGNPGRIPFIPIVRPRVEYLKGKYLEAGIPHKIGCSNSYAQGLYQQERLDMFVKELTRRVTTTLQQQAQGGAAQGQEPDGAALLKQDELKKLAEQGAKFQSSLEIDAQNILTDFIENPELRTLDAMQTHLENILVERETAFDTRPGEPGMLAKHCVIRSGELYTDTPVGQRYSTEATAFVRRELLTVQQVLTKWGHKISAAERRTVAGERSIAGPWENLPLGGEKYLDFYRTASGETVMQTEDYRNWINKQDGSRTNLVEVFTCQWIASNEIDLDDVESLPPAVAEQGLTVEQLSAGTAHHLNNVAPSAKGKKKRTRWVQHLYETVRIGSNIYPEMGELEAAIRPTNEPWRVLPTFRRYVMDVSLIEKSIDAQDKSDIFHYLAENGASLSGTKGTMVPTSDIPQELGATIHERLKKTIGYRKAGLGLINPMQDGGTKGQFSNYQSFDDTLSGDMLTGYRTFIEMYDEQVSNITGVNRQMLGAIAERDGKAVTEQAVQGGTVVTKPIFTLFDILMGDAFTDVLNYSRQSLAAGRPTATSMLMLGEVGRKTFLVDVDKFSLGYFRVNVRDGQKQKQQLDKMIQLAGEFAANNILPAEEAIEAIFIESATEAREHLVSRLREGQAAKMQQMQQENEQLKKQVEQYEKQAQTSGQVQDQVAQQEVALKGREVAVAERAQATEADQGERELDLKAQEVALQRDQAVHNASPSSEKVASI